MSEHEAMASRILYRVIGTRRLNQTTLDSVIDKSVWLEYLEEVAVVPQLASSLPSLTHLKELSSCAKHVLQQLTG
jgi:hypothetical protein